MISLKAEQIFYLIRKAYDAGADRMRPFEDVTDEVRQYLLSLPEYMTENSILRGIEARQIERNRIRNFAIDRMNLRLEPGQIIKVDDPEKWQGFAEDEILLDIPRTVVVDLKEVEE